MAPITIASYKKQDYFFTPPQPKPTLYPPSTTTGATTTTTTSATPMLNIHLPGINQPSLGDLIQIEWDDRPTVVRDYEAFYDMHIKFFGLFEFRIWMLLAAGAALVTTMIIITCCIIRLRIPRSRREIEILAARRRERINVS
ncbi:hypothetical protein PMAYCL1PPCAC_33452 [Pristionchus mayeri]|uniref:Uncharacterized protein n=1 Tax=Pristionchus mayeri TaxID=1317129 RepID=A0AAN5DI99_9BILA|nr:hypothetical protein PMAYCL1PPCAC_01444 [Pristionchus mayeri]GMR63257.1 hypothetical protein PMAYCL1PPCAC_33452 [Pristionchus mayeri]